ncbi:hypothetical protein [Aeromicrobium alkaliterrae]|uniref:Uncharacterized protein n=1 Tax=Aeromicrobium alkaliterrae TaxID=302168 RepID=A0ABN2JZH8_9ACTN
MSRDEVVPSGIAPAALVMFYVGAFVALAFPALFLATGIQAIGRARGWWVGDSNANDGEEVFSTVIGSVGTLGVLIVVTWFGYLICRGYGKSVRFTVVGRSVGTVAVVAAHVVYACFLFRPA